MQGRFKKVDTSSGAIEVVTRGVVIARAKSSAEAVKVLLRDIRLFAINNVGTEQADKIQRLIDNL